MDSKIASEERLHFRDRLQSALRKAGIPVRASTVTHAFNLRADGASVTTHAVRKWLVGDAIPTHERLLILANWLGVHASWLLYGDAENGQFATQLHETPFETQELILIRDYKRLSPAGQQVLRDILTAMLETMSAAGKAPQKTAAGTKRRGP